MSDARQVSGEQPADIRVRHALLLRKVGDRLRAAALDSAPPAVRADERLHQCVVAAWLRCRHGCSLGRHDQLPATAALQAHRDADGQSVDLETLGTKVSPAHVVLCLVDLKLARLARDPKHLDSIVDVAGYAAVLREVSR
jgi:Domain of unknown function (DUF6378)